MSRRTRFNDVLAISFVVCAFLHASVGLAAVMPVVTKISPMFGATGGGTVVTITGSNFVVGATTVAFGASSGTSVSCASVTQCTATSPAGSGTVSVRATTASGTSADTAADDFTYTAPASACTVFSPATNFTVGSVPFSVAIGDFNGDGISDLAVANNGSTTVSILLGTGTGTFGAATNFTVGTNPSFVAIGDFNGDGKSDLAVANNGSTTVSILLGTGTGTFGAATNVTVGTNPFSVAIGDFNGDGKSDLAVTNQGSNNVSILLGTGTGTFGAATNFTIGTAPNSVAIGDFNGDGKSDLAVANAGSNNVSILLGTGTGTFGAATSFAVGSFPTSVAIGDFNGDGISDLAVANKLSNTGSILLGTGTGTFGAATNFTVGTNPQSVAIGDFNGDGISDLAVANIGTNNVSILLGTGTGTFGAATNFAAGPGSFDVAIGDFNGDGKSDLAVANAGSNNVSILLNAGCTPVVTSISPSSGATAGGTVVTITGSNFVIGAATIKFGAIAGTSATCSSTTQCTATSPAGIGTVSVRVTNSSGTSADTAADDFTYTAAASACTVFSPATNFTVGSNPQGVAIGDFNGDGKSDLAVANISSNNVSILLGTGTGTFGAATNFTVGTTPVSVAIGDFNGDGKSDLAVANFSTNNVSILLGTGTGTFGAATNFTVGSGPISVAIGDFNGDGISDLAVANQGSNNVSILLGTGTGTFGAATNFTVGSVPTSVAIGDFNGDGKSDLAVANGTSNNVSILLGTGIGTFGAATNFTVGTNPQFVAIGDFNGDGKSDLAAANANSNNVSILLGTGTGTFGAATNFTVGSGPSSVAIGDFNGDGKSDLAVANGTSNNVSILLGTGTGTFGAATNFTVGANSRFVAIGDFNGDGKSDLAVANSGSTTVSILLNAGCPPTVTSINPTSGTNAGGTVVTITGTNFVVGATTVAFGGSAGTSVSCASITQCTATSPAGSGTVHVTVTTAGGTSATSAADQFTYFVPVPVVTAINPSSGPTTGGTVVTISGSNFIVGATTVKFGATAGTSVSCSSTTQCTATSPAGRGTVSVRVITASGTSVDSANDDFTYTAAATACTTFSPATTVAAGARPFAVATADFNGDGILDLAVANRNSNNVSILLGSGTGTFGAATNFAAGTGPVAVAIGDFNGDGINDLAVPNTSSSNVSILLGTGTGTFGAATNLAAGANPRFVAVGDFNGDGISDLAVANQGSGNVSIFLGTGTGTFGAATNFTAGTGPTAVAVGDFNGDGINDLAVANFNSNNVSILLGTGSGTFGAATNFAAGASPAALAIGDFNGDGKSDLAVGNFGSNDVSILLGTGTGAFGAATNFGAGTFPFSVVIADFNGDGKIDLAVANNAANVSILIGTGTGTFGAATNIAAGANPSSVAIGDFNGDGKSDLAVSNNGPTNLVSILLNAFCPPTVTSISPTSGPTGGGTVVTITGTNLVVGATTVAFGGSAGTSVSCASITQCTATSPAGSGTVDVTVTTAGGPSATSPADQFTYFVPVPVVTSISPSTGPTAGGTIVTITGSNFVIGAATIKFGAIAGTSATCSSTTQCTATSPAGSGTVDVKVTTAGGTSATSAADQFTYLVPVPVVSSINPSTGPTAGGTVVTITGSNFTGVTGVAFGANAGTSVTCATANQCTATSPAGSGTVDVRVTTAGGTSATSAADQFTYSVQADIAALVSAPPSAANGSAFAYTVKIINLGGSDATAVSFNATLPPNVTFNSASPAICSGAPNLVCTVGALPNQSAAVVVISVTANGAGAAPINVFAAGNEFDPNSANNSASASPSITAEADLGIAVTGTPSTVPGSRAVYTMIVTNSGPDVANNVAVNVTASAGLTFNANGGACTGSFPCALGTLSSGQSVTIISAWDISPAAAGSVKLTVNATSPAADPNSSNNSASATTLIGTCPAIIINVPSELISGASAQASAAATAALSGGATYNWSISNGTIDSGNGTDTISFTAGTAGTATIAVNVTGTSCTLSTTALLTVKPRLTCQGTATPVVPAAGTTTADAVVAFRWTAIDGASGYRLWLQDGDAPPQSLGRALDTSLTKAIPTGSHHWYVETLFDGCASHQSEHRALTILPAQDCDTHGAPQLTAPASDAATTSATVAFSWDAVTKAIEYELWLAPAGGVPTLIRVTSDTSYTATVPPGRSEWYVRAVFGGCAAAESAHQTFTYTLPPECTSQRPMLIAPAEGEQLTSPVSFEWRPVSGATSYELYVDGVLAATTTSPRAPGIPVPLDERRWRVRALLAEGCAALDSAESRVVVIKPLPSCAALDAPVITAPPQISSGVTGRIQWTFVAGATAYVVQISSDPQFPPASTSSSTVTERQLPFTFTNESSVSAARYVRVYAIDTECVVPGTGPFSRVAVLSVLPITGSGGVASLNDPADVPYTLSIASELAGLHFAAAPTVPWITVTPASGIVPPGGQTLRAVAHTADMPPGTSTGTVVITTAASAGTPTVLIKRPVTLDNLPPGTTKPKNTPPPDALTIPAVANVKGFIVRYQSDVCVANTSAQVIKYEINFVPTGLPGISQGQTTNVTIEPGATLALNDIVTTWFGGLSSSGTLEIRPLTEIGTSTSSAPASGLANRVTFASSRTFAVAPDGGTYGQYVPAVPYTNFVAKGSVISLQQIAQSEKYHTNLGLVEGSGEPVSVQVRIFDSAGTKRGDFNVDLTGGQHTQLNEVLKEHGIALDDGRIEVEVTKGEGKVTAYASVIDNEINAPMLVPPVTLDGTGHSKWVVPGVAGLTAGSGNWRTDVRIFNAGKEPVDLTLAFYSRNGGTAPSRTTTLAAGEVRQLDSVLSSFFGVSQDSGALHVSTAAPALLIVTARTYNETGQGAYGQFIPAATPEDAVSAGSRPLQILQVEESAGYRSNVGFAEVSGKAVTLEVSVFRPDHTDPVLLEVKLGPNEFRQIDSLLSTLGLDETFNARISVRAVDGEGRATAYLSLIDMKSGDPTYVPGQ
jgi:hypothetical protein